MMFTVLCHYDLAIARVHSVHAENADFDNLLLAPRVAGMNSSVVGI